MRALRWLVVLWSLCAHGQTCYEWRAGSFQGGAQQPSPYVDTPQEAADYFTSTYCPSQYPTGSCSVACGNGQVSDTWSITVYPAFTTFPATSAGTLKLTCTSNGVEFNRSITVGNRVKAAGCPVCRSGEEKTFSGTGSVSSAPSKVCFAGCEFIKSGVGVGGNAGYAQSYRSTGSTCASAPGNTGLDGGEDSDCTASGSTVSCAGGGGANGDGGGGKNCGEFNGDRVCPGSIPPGTCVGYASGGVACVSDASGNPPTSPPAPNNGSEGTPAEPDGTVQVPVAGGGTIIGEYYGPGVVAGSTGTGSGPGGSTVGAPGGVPSGTPGTGGSGTGTGGEGGTCTGSGCNAGVPTLTDIGTVAEAFGSFWTSLQAVPLIDAAGDIGGSLGSGACPNWSTSVSVFGESWDIDFSGICTTWDDVAAVLSIVMLVFWGFVAFRILFSA